MLAFFFRRVNGHGAFIGMLAGEAAIVYTAMFTGISFLWYNVIGCAVVVAAGALVSLISRSETPLLPPAGSAAA